MEDFTIDKSSCNYLVIPADFHTIGLTARMPFVLSLSIGISPLRLPGKSEILA